MTEDSFITIGIYGIQDVNNSDTPTLSHDHGICIMKNGKIILNIQLERLNRKKHSDGMPSMLYKLLKDKKLLDKKCNYIFVDNVLGRCFINDIGNIRFEAPINDGLSADIESGRLWWLNKVQKGFALNHELAHLGSCLPFFGKFKENSLLVHFDGGASKSNFSVWIFKNGELTNLDYHWKLKYLSSLFNANALTFAIVNAKQHELNSVPGKFMGFAAYGEYNAKIENWLQANNFFENIWASKKTFFASIKTEFGIDLQHFDQKHPLIRNIAATIHAIFVRDALKEFKNLANETKAENLYYSGGSALNIVLNTALIESDIFKNVFIPPCCNDSGLAIGAAAFFEWKKNNELELTNACLNNWNIEDYITYYDTQTLTKTAELLVDKKIIGICNNYGEVGPRALGNRSIICLADSKKLAQKVSEYHKKREWYRPVAPIMLEKNTRYFTGKQKINPLSNFMLLDFNILPEKIQELEGAVHVDGTSRIQTVFTKADNPFVFDLLTLMDDKYNVKALINTSFNSRGEPIVHTLEDAKKSAQNMNLDAVILNGKLELLS